MSDNLVKPEGALYDCLAHMLGFEDDLDVLIREGYVEVTSAESCVWLKSKTSLAEYFKWASGDTGWVPGGFWAPIENAFGIKRHSLRKLAGNNANVLKPPLSRDFMKIKPILEQLRAQKEERYNERQVYMYIKHLFIFAENEESETIHEILEKIVSLFIKNVDKNIHNRR